MIDWGTVFSKKPDKKTFSRNSSNWKLQYQSLKLYDYQGIPKILWNRPFSRSTTGCLFTRCCWKFHKQFWGEKFSHSHTHVSDRFFENGIRTVLSGNRVCHHNVKSAGSSPPKQENKDTNCPSQCSFKLKPCNKAGTCKCLCFKINNCHNHVVDGGDSLKWHNVLLLFINKSCQCRKPKLSMRK